MKTLLRIATFTALSLGPCLQALAEAVPADSNRLVVDPAFSPAAHAAQMAQVYPTLVTGQAKIDIPLQLPPATDSFDWIRNHDDSVLVLRYRSPRSGVPSKRDAFAPGWDLSLPRIDVAADGSATLDGGALVPTSMAQRAGCTASYVRTPADHAHISYCRSTDSWIRVSVSGDVYTFRRSRGGLDGQRTYRLHEVETPDGLVWRARWHADRLRAIDYTLHRNEELEILSALGDRREVELTWNEDTLDSVTVWLGDGDHRQRVRRYDLDYDSRGRLTSVQLLGATDADSFPATHYGYDKRDRLISTQNGFGAGVTLAYNTDDDTLHQLDEFSGPGAPRVQTQIRYHESTTTRRYFAVVEVRRSDSIGTTPSYERYSFYTGDKRRTLEIPEAFADRSTADHPALAGRLLAVQMGPDPKTILAESWTLWSVAPNSVGGVSAHLSHTAQIDRTQEPRASWMLADSFYDADGNVVRFEDHADQRTVETQYARDPDGRIRDAISLERETLADGTVLLGKVSYDHEPHGEVRRGTLSRFEYYVDGRLFDARNYTVDDHGNTTRAQHDRSRRDEVRRWTPSGAHAAFRHSDQGTIELTWDERFGVMTAVSAAGQRITNEIDGWGRSLLIRAPGVTVRTKLRPPSTARLRHTGDARESAPCHLPRWVASAGARSRDLSRWAQAEPQHALHPSRAR